MLNFILLRSKEKNGKSVRAITLPIPILKKMQTYPRNGIFHSSLPGVYHSIIDSIIQDILNIHSRLFSFPGHGLAAISNGIPQIDSVINATFNFFVINNQVLDTKILDDIAKIYHYRHSAEYTTLAACLVVHKFNTVMFIL